jgi:hypothetical protein
MLNCSTVYFTPAANWVVAQFESFGETLRLNFARFAFKALDFANKKQEQRQELYRKER